VAAAPPQLPTYAIKLSDGTSLGNVTRTLLASRGRAVQAPWRCQKVQRGVLEPRRAFFTGPLKNQPLTHKQKIRGHRRGGLTLFVAAALQKAPI